MKTNFEFFLSEKRTKNVKKFLKEETKNEKLRKKDK